MAGQFTNGFSLQDWNSDKKRENAAAARRERFEDNAMNAAKELLVKIQGGQMVTLHCVNEALKVKFLKNLVRSDSRFAWRHHGDNISFSARKKPTQESPLKTGS